MTKKQVKEAIRDRHKVFRVFKGKISEIQVGDCCRIYDRVIDCGKHRLYEILLDEVFKTYEEAKHYVKYGNIKKIVKLPTPATYEEFLKEEYFTIDWIGSIFLNEGDTETIYFNSKNCKFDLPNTEENYYKCVDKMIELWKKEI